MFSGEKMSSFILEGDNGIRIKIGLLEVTNGTDAEHGKDKMPMFGWRLLPNGDCMAWLNFLEEHGARNVEDSDRDAYLTLFARTGGEFDEVVILKIPKEFIHVPMTDKERHDQISKQNAEREAGLSAALAKDPTYKYTVLSGLLYDNGHAEGEGVDAFDPSTWVDGPDADWPMMDDWLYFTDNLSDWAFAFTIDSEDEDEPTMFYFSPIGDWITDREWPGAFIEKLVQPHFEEEITAIMESCFSVENMTEKEVAAKLKALGIKEMPRED